MNGSETIVAQLSTIIKETATTNVRARAQHPGHYLDKTQALACQSCKMYSSWRPDCTEATKKYRSCLPHAGRANEFSRLSQTAPELFICALYTPQADSSASMAWLQAI